jgi:hypothetical protein
MLLPQGPLLSCTLSAYIAYYKHMYISFVDNFDKFTTTNMCMTKIYV